MDLLRDVLQPLVGAGGSEARADHVQREKVADLGRETFRLEQQPVEGKAHVGGVIGREIEGATLLDQRFRKRLAERALRQHHGFRLALRDLAEIVLDAQAHAHFLAGPGVILGRQGGFAGTEAQRDRGGGRRKQRARGLRARLVCRALDDQLGFCDAVVIFQQVARADAARRLPLGRGGFGLHLLQRHLRRKVGDHGEAVLRDLATVAQHLHGAVGADDAPFERDTRLLAFDRRGGIGLRRFQPGGVTQLDFCGGGFFAFDARRCRAHGQGCADGRTDYLVRRGSGRAGEEDRRATGIGGWINPGIEARRRGRHARGRPVEGLRNARGPLIARDKRRSNERQQHPGAQRVAILVAQARVRRARVERGAGLLGAAAMHLPQRRSEGIRRAGGRIGQSRQRTGKVAARAVETAFDLGACRKAEAGQRQAEIGEGRAKTERERHAPAGFQRLKGADPAQNQENGNRSDSRQQFGQKALGGNRKPGQLVAGGQARRNLTRCALARERRDGANAAVSGFRCHGVLPRLGPSVTWPFRPPFPSGLHGKVARKRALASGKQPGKASQSREK